MKASESQIKKSITDYLNLQENLGRCYFIRNNSVSGKLIRPDGSIGWIKNNKPGAPDIIILIAGKFVGVEIKSSVGKQSPEQKQAQEFIERLGGIYVLARGIEDITWIFK